MRTSERYVKLIAIPVTVAGIVALTASIIYQSTEPDGVPREELDLANMDSIPSPIQDGFDEQFIEKEISSLQSAFASMRRSTQKQSEGTDSPNAGLKELGNEVEQRIESLSNATSQDWEVKRDLAYQALENYATAVGEEQLAQSN